MVGRNESDRSTFSGWFTGTPELDLDILAHELQLFEKLLALL